MNPRMPIWSREMEFNEIICCEQLADWENAKEKADEYIKKYPDDEAAQKERRNSSRQGNRVRQGAAQAADVRSRVGPGSCLNGSGPLFHPEDGEKESKEYGNKRKNIRSLNTATAF